MQVRVPSVVIAAALAVVCAAWFYFVTGRGRGRVARLACAAVGGALFWAIQWQVPLRLPAVPRELSQALSRYGDGAGSVGFWAAAVVATFAAGALGRLMVAVRRPRVSPAPQAPPAPPAPERKPMHLLAVEELPLLAEARPRTCPHCGQALPRRGPAGRPARVENPGHTPSTPPPTDAMPADAAVVPAVAAAKGAQL